MIFMMIGLPGSGKSTIARKMDGVYVNADQIRGRLYGSESQQGDPKKVFEEVERQVRSAINDGLDVVLDNTNLIKRWRKQWIDMAPCVAVVVPTPLEECLARNAARERKVPEDVIRRMASQYEEPTLDEGFISIRVL